MGLENISLDENGYLMATLPGNIDKKVPTVGFIAHLDTSPDMSGRHVNPRIVKAYEGGDIVLDKDSNVVLSPADFPELCEYKGQDLIVTDGKTLHISQSPASWAVPLMAQRARELAGSRLVSTAGQLLDYVRRTEDGGSRVNRRIQRAVDRGFADGTLL